MNEIMNEVKITAKSTKAEILEYLKNLEESNKSHSLRIGVLMSDLHTSNEEFKNLENLLKEKSKQNIALTRTIIDKDVAIASIKDSLEREFVSKKALLAATIVDNSKVIKRLRCISLVAYMIAAIAILIAIFK